jgi:hypothetical protein
MVAGRFDLDQKIPIPVRFVGVALIFHKPTTETRRTQRSQGDKVALLDARANRNPFQ